MYSTHEDCRLSLGGFQFTIGLIFYFGVLFSSDRQFLMGFRKRKQERKEKYIEKLERDLAKEKKRIKQQVRKNCNVF